MAGDSQGCAAATDAQLLRQVIRNRLRPFSARGALLSAEARRCGVRRGAAFFSGVRLSRVLERVHTNDERSLAGTSLGSEIEVTRGEESRLKAGCSQDWLPHKTDERPRPVTVVIVALAAASAFAQMPAGTRHAERADSGTSVLPGGRYITPLGEQFFTGPGPFGLAISPSGQFVVSADGGPNRYALTVLDTRNGNAVKHLYAARKRSRGKDADDADADPDDPEWLSVFMGLAFDGERTLFASEGESGKVRAIDIFTGKREAVLDLNRGGYRDSYTGDIAIDSARGLLFVVDQANFRLVMINLVKP